MNDDSAFADSSPSHVNTETDPTNLLNKQAKSSDADEILVTVKEGDENGCNFCECDFTNAQEFAMHMDDFCYICIDCKTYFASKPWYYLVDPDLSSELPSTLTFHASHVKKKSSYKQKPFR